MVTLKTALPRWYQQGGYQHHSQQVQRPHPSKHWFGFAAACALTYLLAQKSWHTIPHCEDHRMSSNYTGLTLKEIPQHLHKFQDCSISNLAANLSFLDSASPLPVAEFVYRRDRLAQALYNEGLDAFLVEPGYTFSYYANVTQPEWEVWVSAQSLHEALI